MKTGRYGLLVAWLLLLPALITAQPDLSAPAPVDPDIRMGKLDNGLTYFVRYNKEPEKRASFYFIQNVGALLENDDQNGLAHFLEHMAFNGTEHFPGKAIISSLEKHGVAFGYNINAYTGHDETVYNLSDVPVDPPGLMDTCLLIMYDWSDFITLSDEEINAERGVITEEWRTRRDANFRMMQKYLPVLLKDSKYAVRDVIGDLNVIQNFGSERIKEFYAKWYRPDLQAVAVAGDFDPDEMVGKIKTLFSKLKPAVNPEPRPVFAVPYHKETLFVLATDREAPQTSVSIIIKRKSDDDSLKNLNYIRRQMMIGLMNAMMGTRISELLQKGTPPFISGSISYSGLVRGLDALAITASANPNEEDVALRAVYTEAERARRYGFTNGELERAKANLLTQYENYYKQKDKIPNDAYIQGMQDYFLTKEPLTSIDFDFSFLKEELPGITAEEVSGLFSGLMGDENRVIMVEGLEGENIKHLDQKSAEEIISEVKAARIDPYEDTSLGESLISKELEGSPVVKTTKLDRLDAVEWTLSNNVRVVYRKADYEKDNVILTAYSLGGTSLYDVDHLPSAVMLPAIIDFYGLGDYDNVTLQKMLAGKKAIASALLGEITEGINGSSTPRDFETMLQLLYLRFSNPRFDTEAHNAIMSRYVAYLKSMENDPSKIMQDSVSLFLTNFSPRTILLNPEMLSKVNLDQIRQIYTERFRDASDFVFFIVGNIEESEAKPIIEKYIGSLETRGSKETFIDRQVRPPKGKFMREVRIPLTVPKSTVFISHSSSFKYTPYNNVCLKVINGILDLVYTEKVREEAGGTYGVSVSLTSQKYPYENMSGLIMFDCDPEKAASLKQIIYNEIDKLEKEGPAKEYLDKAVSNMLKTREEAKLHNDYWSDALYSYYYTGIDVNDPANYEDILNSLTVKDIRKAARMIFRKADVADIVFSPR